MDSVVLPLRDFAKNSIRLVNKCTKPDRREYEKICSRTALGFVLMGFIGFFVKLIFIPINQIIVGGTTNVVVVWAWLGAADCLRNRVMTLILAIWWPWVALRLVSIAGKRLPHRCC